MKRMIEAEADLAKAMLLELRKKLDSGEITKEEFMQRREPLKVVIATAMWPT